MNIDEKLALSAREGIVSFIREGMFYRCYQQSLFAYLTHLSGNVKVLHKQVKCLDGLDVFYGGFPESRLSSLPDGVISTEWGIEMHQPWSPEQYDLWQKEQTSIARANSSQPERIEPGTAEGAFRDFLLSWEEGKFPREVDSGFISSLKKHIA